MGKTDEQGCWAELMPHQITSCNFDQANMVCEMDLMLNSARRHLTTRRAACGRKTKGSVTQIEGRGRVRVGWVGEDMCSMTEATQQTLCLVAHMLITHHETCRTELTNLPVLTLCCGDYLPKGN